MASLSYIYNIPIGPSLWCSFFSLLGWSNQPITKISAVWMLWMWISLVRYPNILLGMCQIDKDNLHKQRSMECIGLGEAISNITLELKL